MPGFQFFHSPISSPEGQALVRRYGYTEGGGLIDPTGLYALGEVVNVITGGQVPSSVSDQLLAPEEDQPVSWPDDEFTGGGSGWDDPVFDPGSPDFSVDIPDYDPGQALPIDVGGPDIDLSALSTARTLLIPTAGQPIGLGVPRAAATGGGMASMGRSLANVFGRAAGRVGAMFTINGVRGSMRQLWKYTQRFGVEAVAAGIGMSAGALATMLLNWRASGGSVSSTRRRGVSSRDIRTATRTMRTIGRMQRQLQAVCPPSRGRGRGYAPRPRRARRPYYC